MTSTYDDQSRNLLQLYIDSNIDKEFFILSNKKNAFFIIDKQGKIVYVNQLCEEKLGYSSTDMLAMRIRDLFAETELDKGQIFFKDKVPETLSTFNTQIYVSPGECLWVKLTFFPIYYSGEYLGTFIILRDPQSK
ncbi:PAS domain-containing protein [Mesobacillus maritimus]|uniref:PAS domain-containing protein n=1 Tax=Mesobacillus maritimus TaxID=1643336 RepID=A0ABS7K6K8_9BACI|nr:PAS domain-containing protein [Mesobacillus maritimus]MBY0097884.1 PAS domain-containing protein [Mesobacillus maritimus]